MARLADKTAIVTGASKGLGRAIAQVFAGEGAKVLVVYHSDAEGARDVVDAIRSCGGVAEQVAADVSRQRDNELMVREAVARFGSVDILCANAGIFPFVKLEDMAEDQWDRMFEVNLKSVFWGVRACLPHMKTRMGGRVVVTASTTGPRTAVPGACHYAASKAGLMGFVRNASLELAQYGITVNAVEPGLILTEGARKMVDEPSIEKIAREIPLGTWGEPKDVAHAALYLASDEARYVTGQSIVVDGGLILPEMPLSVFGM